MWMCACVMFVLVCVYVCVCVCVFVRVPFHGRVCMVDIWKPVQENVVIRPSYNLCFLKWLISLIFCIEYVFHKSRT